MHLRKKEITCPCQNVHTAQYLRKSSAVAGQEKSQFNLCLPLPNPLQIIVCVPLAENLPDSPPAFGVPGSVSEPVVKWGSRSRSNVSLPSTPPIVGLGLFPPQAGAPPHWDHPSSQEHTCHRAGAQPAAGQWPHSLDNNARLREGGFTVGENQDHPNSYSKHYQGVKKYFSAEAASTVRQRPAQGMPGPQLTSLCLSRARPPRSAPRPPPLRPLPPAAAPSRALTSWGPASVAPPVWRRNVGLQRLLPPPPSLPPQPPPKRCPARRRGWKLGAHGIPGGAGSGRGGAAPR